ncbi:MULTISPECIES: glucosamine inositolphosphorylceramide transferase family protein [unclassified Moraxella]|uniref:glucosamine inositolphosphorylceramide transferase family protein n=1 Tax=unclassified Moraxella TaxID=2685852 RepID=UPI003AF6C8ED
MLKKYFYHEEWNIGIAKKSSDLTLDTLTNICQDDKIVWLAVRYHFQADPFLFEYQGKLYVFYEALNHSWVKGHLRCRVLDSNLHELEDFALDDINALGSHLSFPQVWQTNGEIFLMPESHEKNAIYIFKAIDFPKKWQVVQTIDNGKYIDSVVFENNNQKWLVTSLHKTAERKVFGYQNEAWKAIEIEYISDDNHSRLGGGAFRLVLDEQVYLPVQENHLKEYGKSLFIKALHINSNSQPLTWQELTQTQIQSQSVIYPDGLHTLNISENYIIIDAKRWVFQPFNFFVRKYRQIKQAKYHASLKLTNQV